MIEPLNTGAQLGLFSEACGKFWNIVRDGLSVEKINRLGNRYGYFFAGDEKPKETLSRLSMWQPAAATSDFGEPNCDGVVLRFENPSTDRRIRLEVVQAQASIKNVEKMGIILDIDFTTVEDPPLNVDVVEFIRANQKFTKTYLHQLLR